MIHHVNGSDLEGPFPEQFEIAYFGMGCFWGAERLFWSLDGVFLTSVGFTGGTIINPTYESVCSGSTNHVEAVQVVYDPNVISYIKLLEIFWKSHNPTQEMRQGNDRGTQYRSAIFCTSEDHYYLSLETRTQFQHAIINTGSKNLITTEISYLEVYYFAEEYHQQYLSKNPNGYCGIKGNGIQCDFVI
jgi:peptide-methionine (S)-S-oxide reductase